MQDPITSLLGPLFLAILFILSVYYFMNRRDLRWKEQNWTGLLLEKEVQKRRCGPFVQTRYWLIIQTDQGERIQKEVFSERFYNSFQPGDRIEKRKGEDYPRKPTDIG